MREEVLVNDECMCKDGAKCNCGNECHCGDACTCEDNCECQNIIDEEKEKEHKNKLNDAYNKISELEDKLIRQNADMVNYRKRKEEEVNKMLKFCHEDLIKDILPILDNFERAISMEAGLNEEEKKFLDGFKMVYTHLQNVMEKYDVKMIDGNNQPFDPVYHNAILLEKKEGVEPGMVIEILQKGYLLKDKVIRTAMVKVSE